MTSAENSSRNINRTAVEPNEAKIDRAVTSQPLSQANTHSAQGLSHDRQHISVEIWKHTPVAEETSTLRSNLR